MKKLRFCLLLAGLLGLLTGCVTKMEETGKIKDPEFTVVKKEDIPEEMAALIEEQGDQVFRITFTDQGYLYIAQGYGAKPTTGYSVEVAALYETENAIVLETALLGPESGEEIKEKTTCPYVVVKLEAVDKPVQFE